MSSVLRKSVLVLFTLLLSVTVALAQDDVCPLLVSQALASLDANCGGLGRNETCYSYDRVEAGFISAVPEDFFTKPADTAAVADLQTLRTTPLDEQNGTWGLAVMNLQANLPNTLPGQSVKFVLMGDVQIENAVTPEDVFTPSDGMTITANVAAGANIRSGPGLNFNVIGAAQDGAELQADGLSEDGEWLRVVYRDRPAWISRSVVDDVPEIKNLPILTGDLRTPMQAFYLRTGVGQTSCTEAMDDILLVQGPKNVEIQLTVNGAQVALRSTGAFRTVLIDGEWFLEIIVFDGEFEVGGVTIRTGQHSYLCLGNGDSPDRDVSCDPTPPERIPDFGAEWCVMEGVPSDILNYGIEVLCPGETPPAATFTGATVSRLSDVSCANFGLVAPLGTVDAGTQHFEWTPARGSNIEYELVFYNYLGQQANTFRTTSTAYDVNLGSETSTGGAFSWEVRAYQNGDYACVTHRSPEMGRVDVPSLPSAGFGVTVSCVFSMVAYSNTAVITWSGLPSGETITMTLSDPPLIDSRTSSSPSGNVTLQTPGSFLPGSVFVSTSDGFSRSYGCS